MDGVDCEICGLAAETVIGGYDQWRTHICWDCLDALADPGSPINPSTPRDV